MSGGQSLPKRGWALGRWFGRTFLRIGGWRIEGELPQVPKVVALCAPHTSNWDFFWGLAAMLALDIELSWVGKHTIFRWPVRRFLRYLGGTPLVRSSGEGRVQEIAKTIRDAPDFIFGIAQEGTRKPVARWKTGFYHVAREANVPIWLAYFDYKRKVVGLGPLFFPTDDTQADLLALRKFYADKTPCKPENFIPFETTQTPE